MCDGSKVDGSVMISGDICFGGEEERSSAVRVTSRLLSSKGFDWGMGSRWKDLSQDY